MLNIVRLSTEILDLIAVELSLNYLYEHEYDDSVTNRLERNTNLTRHCEVIGRDMPLIL